MLLEYLVRNFPATVHRILQKSYRLLTYLSRHLPQDIESTRVPGDGLSS